MRMTRKGDFMAAKKKKVLKKKPKASSLTHQLLKVDKELTKHNKKLAELLTVIASLEEAKARLQAELDAQAPPVILEPPTV
jgi:chromosome segregation ATPase